MAGRAVQVVALVAVAVRSERGRGREARLQVLHAEVVRRGRVRPKLERDGRLVGVLLVADVAPGLALGERRAPRRREHRPGPAGGPAGGPPLGGLGRA